MKRRILIAVLAVVTLLLPVGAPAAVRAETRVTYAAAAVREAYFYPDKNGSSLFAVPYTYCIEVLGEEGEWLRAAYAADNGIYKKLYGYCKRDDFMLLEGEPKYTYLYKAVGVDFKPDAESGSLPTLDIMSVEAAYYGVYRAGGEAYSYVYCRGSFGYIYGANDDYPLNELPQKDTFEETEPPAEEEKKSGFNGTALICALVILALFAGVILMIFFTAKRPRRM